MNELCSLRNLKQNSRQSQVNTVETIGELLRVLFGGLDYSVEEKFLVLKCQLISNCQMKAFIMFLAMSSGEMYGGQHREE